MRNFASAVTTILTCVSAVTAAAVPVSSSKTSTSWRSEPTFDSSEAVGVAQTPSIYEPYQGGNCPGYKAVNVTTWSSGMIAKLVLAGEPCNAYGVDYEVLDLVVTNDKKNRLHISITDEGGKNFQLTKRPDIWTAPLVTDAEHVSSDKAEYIFKYNAEPFEFWVMRKDDYSILFDTRGYNLIFENQYIELSTSMVPDYNIYGMAETMRGIRLGNNLTRTFWANDDGSLVDGNMYGSHPFYLENRYSSTGCTNSHGVLYLTSGGLEVLLREDSLQYRAISGVIDLYIFTGPDAMSTLSQYNTAIGLPAMPAYWSLGFHQSRWGYENVSTLESVVAKFKENNLPLDTIWSDIDYLYEFRDFTTDPVSFSQKDMQKFLAGLKATNQHWVPIVDAAIYAANPANRSDDSYYPYYKGTEMDVWLKNPDMSTYIGDVWPGYTVFPDWVNPRATDFWVESLMNMSIYLGEKEQGTTFSGIWIDMNEVSSFCVGSCGSGDLDVNPVHPPFSLPNDAGSEVTIYPDNVTTPLTKRSVPEFNVNYPPYALNNFQGNHDLSGHIVGVNATSVDGTLRYDIFNLWGYGESVASYKALSQIRENVRPFILSRSTFVGSGAVAAHWLGDNNARWDHMAYSIPGVLTFNLLGVPHVGPDTCGFGDNTDEELCTRWMALSAFFPFYRNHNTYGARSQEPYMWNTTAEASRRAMAIRYQLLPYWYTLFYEAHTKGTPVVRPLFLEFPDEPSLADADRQFLVGSAILVTPSLDQGQTTVNGVFPGNNDTIWYDWYTHQPITRKYGENITLEAELEHINVAVRGGYIIPMQEGGLTTVESRQSPWHLLVALDSKGEATGTVYVDDGLSIEVDESLIVELSAKESTLIASPFGRYDVQQPLSAVTILGVSTRPSIVKFEGHSAKFSFANHTLTVYDLKTETKSGAFAKEWELTWK
ncbi:alpha-glucosidase [Dipodascopsis uninucleata]